jgi:hypothetical protein
MAKKQENSAPITPRDGYDNTGTQGYDSLTDDAFTGSSPKSSAHSSETASRTGSSSEDFPDLDNKKAQEEG